MAKQSENPNLVLYDQVRSVPDAAKKSIGGGRLKGMTDINPMWRLKTLTEHFGVCGFGWKYSIVEKRLQPGANGEIACFVDIHLQVKMNGEWSDPILGTGGSLFVANEKNGLYTSDECFKMALTDAISVACKALGFGADVYWEKDRTKYDQQGEPPAPGERTPAPQATGSLTEPQIKRAFAIGRAHNVNIDQIKAGIKRDYGKDRMEDLTKAEYEDLCAKLEAVPV